jgi:hypothetical protein
LRRATHLCDFWLSRSSTGGTIFPVSSLRPAAAEARASPLLGADRAFCIAFAACALAASVAVWGHRFPAGIDLAQHAQLFQMLTMLAGLTLLNRRIYLFDEETRGLYEIADHVPVGASLRGIVEETESWSEAFGPKQHAQAAAWIAALRSG